MTKGPDFLILRSFYPLTCLPILLGWPQDGQTEHHTGQLCPGLLGKSISSALAFCCTPSTLKVMPDYAMLIVDGSGNLSFTLPQQMHQGEVVVTCCGMSLGLCP